MKRTLTFVLCAALAGCNTLKTEMTNHDTPDGSDINYKTSANNWWGKVDNPAAEFKAGIDAAGNWTLSTGQSAAAMDSTASLQLIQSVVGLIAAIAPLLAPAPATGVPPAPTP